MIYRFKVPARALANRVLSRHTKEVLYRTYNRLERMANPLRYNRWAYAKPRRNNYPKWLSIFLTTRCNIVCSICDSREGHRPVNLDFDNLRKLKNPIARAHMIDLTGWGEAVLYPKYAETLEYIFSLNKRPEIISQTTNGVRPEYAELLRGRVARLVISLNAATKETYEREMKGGKFEKTIGNVRHMMSVLTARDVANIRLHFVANTNNYHEMPQFVELARELGIPHVGFGHYLTSGDPEQRVRNRAGQQPDILLNHQAEYNASAAEAEAKGKTLGIEVFYRRFGEDLGLREDLCMKPYEACMIFPDGNVTPCCHMADQYLGNVYEDGFEAVWFGEAFRKLRDARSHPLCSVCPAYHSLDRTESHYNSWYHSQQLQLVPLEIAESA